MKYIVLLRGINISGKNKVDMKTLKEELLKNNLNNVITYLNSGNIILETDLNKEKLTNLFTKILETKFNLKIPIFILNLKELEIKGSSNFGYYVKVEETGKIIELDCFDTAYHYHYSGSELSTNDINKEAFEEITNKLCISDCTCK